MSDLADLLVVSRSGLTYQITQLERQKLVDRITSPEDDRGVVAVLTAEGRETVLAAFPGHVGLVREKFLDLLVPGEADAMRSTLERVIHGLRQS